MSRSSTSRGTLARWRSATPVVLPLVIVVVSIAALWLTTPLRERMVARQLARQLASTETNSSRIETTLEALIELDESGLPALVSLLDAADPAVATAARETLNQQIENWRIRGVHHWSPRVALLVDSLAGQMESFRPPARQKAALYVAELLQWPTSDHIDRGAYLVACDQVLRAANSARTQPEMIARGDRSEKSGRDMVSSRASDGPSMNDQVEQFASLPGGGLPIEATEIPDLPGDGTIRAAARPRSAPRTLELRDEVAPMRQGDRPPRQDSPPDMPARRRARLTPLPWRNTRQVVDHPGESEPGEPVLRAKEPIDPTSEDLLARSTLEVIFQLGLGTENEKSTAERELRRRGLSPYELELARKIAEADAQQRRELVSALPHLSGIDARVWLLWLTEDSDAEVRLTAYRWLATTEDAVALKELRRAARQDEDLRIRRLASELSEQRRLK